MDVKCTKAVSWPDRLGFLSNADGAGLGIALGWHASGPLKQALRSAIRASHALATVIQHIRSQDPYRAVNIVAHSMGGLCNPANLASFCLWGDIGRIILLNGAVFRPCVAAALRSNAGRSAELFNVVSGENAFYDVAV